jgi:hypothetical protein
MIDVGTILRGIRPYVLGWMGIWQTYTPTWAAATTLPVLGNGILTGKYIIRPGGTCLVRIYLAIGSTSTMGMGSWTFSLPMAVADDVVNTMGLAQIKDISAGANYPRLAVLVPNDSVVQYFVQFNDGNTVAASLTATAPFTWATNDYMHVSAEYPVGDGSW